MANVLVTGGAGYVGSVCCAELLRAGHSVVVVDDLSTGFRQAVPPGAPLCQSDIADPRAMRSLFSENKFDACFLLLPLSMARRKPFQSTKSMQRSQPTLMVKPS